MLQVAELIEHEQWVIAHAAEVAVVGAALLLAVDRALARIHVEHDEFGRTPPMHAVDPLPGEIGECCEVLRTREPFRLEPPHLARRGRSFGNRSVADDPSHRRIPAQPLGVVHVLVASEPSVAHRDINALVENCAWRRLRRAHQFPGVDESDAGFCCIVFAHDRRPRFRTT